jgi:hypothetical protein
VVKSVVASIVLSILLFWMFASTEKVTVDVTPRLAMAPTTIRVTVRSKPLATNRGLTVRIDSSDYYRSSFDPDFAGEEGSKIKSWNYELRYPGVYTIQAIQHRAKPDSEEIATITICVSGMDVEC